MRGISLLSGKSLARAMLLAAGMVALAGCATGYAFVQPDAGGSYYTGDAAYAAPAYYYDDGVVAYDPYDAAFGYGSLYGPSFTFGLGFGSPCGWSCTGYYGGWPWYYGAVGSHGRRHYRHHRHGDPVASTPSPYPWPGPDHPRVPPRQIARGAAPLLAVPDGPAMKRLANRRTLDPASFAPRGIDRVTQRASLPDPASYRAPQPPAFNDRPVPSAAPHGFARPAAPAAAPLRMAPPPARSSHSGSDRIR